MPGGPSNVSHSLVPCGSYSFLGVSLGGPLSEHMRLCSVPVICSLFCEGDS